MGNPPGGIANLHLSSVTTLLSQPASLPLPVLKRTPARSSALADYRHLPQLLELTAGDVRPGTGGVDFQIGFPMPRRLEKIAHLLVQQRDVVVSVGVVRVQLQGSLVVFESFI